MRATRTEIFRPGNGILNLRLYLSCQSNGSAAEEEEDTLCTMKKPIADSTDLYRNDIDTTRIYDKLGCFPLFISSKFVLVMIEELAGHILHLRTKYHSKAAGPF